MRVPRAILAPVTGLLLGAASGCHRDMDLENVDPETCLTTTSGGRKIRIDGKFFATPGEADAVKVSAPGTYEAEDGTTQDRWGIARDLHVVFQDDIDEVVTVSDIEGQFKPIAYNPDTVDPLDTEDSWVSEDVWPAQIELAEGTFDDPEDGRFMLVAEPGENWFKDPTDVNVVITRLCEEIVEATTVDSSDEHDKAHNMYDASSGLY